MKSTQSEILLESGTNEIEIFEFLINKHNYGVNALKVRQVVQFDRTKVQELPMMPKGMLGNVLLRDEIIRVIDMRKALDMVDTTNVQKQILILCEFNRQVLGFVVDEIVGIQRVSWSDVHSPSSLLDTSSITGVALINERKISMLDLESILAVMFNATEEVSQDSEFIIPADCKVLVADDSPVIRKKIKWLLDKIQAQNVEYFENGLLLYNRYSEMHAQNKAVGLVLTDIEMPQLDGFACCKKIKALNTQTPVVILSSLINDQIARKCEQVGADVSLNKQDFSKLPDMIAQLLTKKVAA